MYLQNDLIPKFEPNKNQQLFSSLTLLLLLCVTAAHALGLYKRTTVPLKIIYLPLLLCDRNNFRDRDF